MFIKVLEGMGIMQLSKKYKGLGEMEEIKVIARMDHTIDHTYESANRIYSQFGLCPTIPTSSGGGSFA